MPIWNKQPFEELLEKGLKSTLGADEGENFFSRYSTVRDKLLEEIYCEIPTGIRSHTKHDSSHIKQVLKRVMFLIDFDEEILSPFELYVLGIMVLFHDVGNIEGREDHHLKKTVAKIYNSMRGNDPKWVHERYAVLTAIEAHTGKDKEGKVQDTLKGVDDYANLDNGEKIRLKELAAILRFGDECEEGPHRTSQYRQEHASEKGGYDADSMKYHEYSNIANVFIDRGSGRIVLKCHVNYNSKEDVDGKKLRESMEMAYSRIVKLDDERKYARYYSNILIPFKKTEVSFHFSVDNIPVEDFLSSKIELEDDIPIPGKKNGGEVKTIVKMFPEYKIEKILKKLKSEVEV